jgi:hypothetical protein
MKLHPLLWCAIAAVGAMLVAACDATGGSGGAGGKDGAITDAAGDAKDAAVDAPAGETASAREAGGRDTATAEAQPPASCTPGSTLACACANAAVGGMRCAADGKGWSTCDCTAYGAAFFVATNGSDSAAGTEEAPFATLERAQKAIRERNTSGLPAGGVVVWVRGGLYPRTASFQLGSQDSGKAGWPIAYRGYPGESARLLGGAKLSGAAFTTVTSADPAYSRLDPSVQGKVMSLDLAAAGVTDFGTLVRRGFCTGEQKSALELFVDGKPMTLARWPDADQNDPPATATSTQVQIYGKLVPDVTGTYVKDGESDGVSSFTRQGQVGGGGLTYHLYRYYWQYQGTWHRAWFLTTNASGYPSDTNPWWYLYASELGPMEPGTGASGQATFAAPTALNHGFAQVVDRVTDTSFSYAGDWPSRWSTAPDPWLHGFWKYAWADCHLPATKIDATNHVITLGGDPGYGIAANQPWRAYNLLEEITQPGEWYLDRKTGLLYLYPPSDLGSAEILVSLLANPLITLGGAGFVAIEDLTLEAGRGGLVQIDGGSDNVLDGLVLRNAGAFGASISGTRNGIRHAVIHDTGGTGVTLGGGDRPSLTLGANFVENSDIHHFGRWEWTYRPGVNMSGAGQIIRRNRIHEAPHSGILYGGNEHLIERNELFATNQFSSDAGAIYAGRDWGARGNVIRNNFVHDLATWFAGYGVHGIYLDDCLSGIRVEGNLLYRITGNGILHGGGRDDLMLGNLMAHTGTALAADSRCFEWRPDAGPNDTPGDSWNLLEKLNAVGYQKEPWRSRYPECAAIPNDWDAIIDANATWLYPEGSKFSRNAGWQNDAWTSGSGTTFTHYAEMADNQELATSPFVDEAALNLALSPGSAIFAIPGFQDIPFASIGIEH